jgi:hypothetical protein
MKRPSPARFFIAIALHPSSSWLILAATLAIGLWTMRMDPRELDSGLGMLLFVQMFMASTGFLVRARRGHFDPLLVGGEDTGRAVRWHWVVSVAPGVLAWLCLAAAGSVMGSAAAVSALIGARAIALFIVSSFAWVLGFALGRGAGGVVWSAVLLALALRRVELLSSTAVPPSLALPRQAAALIVCPFLLIGRRPPIGLDAICVAALTAALVLLTVWRRSRALDLYLVERA